MKRFLNVLKNVENNRKLQKYLLVALICMISSLTIAYAALNAVLEITGSAEVSAAEWDIRLENPVVTNGSVNNTLPVIFGNKEASFTATLTNPGDFYEFSIDVVNKGSIDAMIDSITKSPTLSETQAKYLNYIVEYQNGEVISNKQLVEANSFVRLKVKVEFRKDLVASDLPTTTETLNLAFTVNYVQAEETGTSVSNNGKESLRPSIISGNLETVGSEVAIGNEHFYIISNTEREIVMLSKYNLYVGNECTAMNSSSCTPYGEEATGIQDSTAKGWFSGYSVENPGVGTTAFSSTNYWKDTTSTYPAYVYNENSYLYEYVENYKSYLEGLGAEINEARLITIEELEGLGCSGTSSSCSGAPEWVYSTTYWVGAVRNSQGVWCVSSGGGFGSNSYFNDYNYGVRPVIVLKS